MTGSLGDYITDSIVTWITQGGELVTDAEYEFRRKQCEGCEHFGDVQVLPLVKTKGCKICGCPFKSKARKKTIQRIEKYMDDPISASEIAKIKSGAETVTQEVTCPHPDGNKWKFKS